MVKIRTHELSFSIKTPQIFFFFKEVFHSIAKNAGSFQILDINYDPFKK